jgi:topoisomerase IA-like protein
MDIKVSDELLILIEKDIEKDEKQLRKCIKNQKEQISLEKNVNLQRYGKYLEKKISVMRSILFELEN